MPTLDRSPQRDALLQAVTEIAPALRESTAEAERERKLPARAVEAMLHADLFRCAAPEAVGGLGADPLTQIEVFEATAAVDGAAGWNLMISALLCALLGSRLDEPAIETIFGSDQWPIIAGLVWPRGRADVSDGGYTVSGRWSFGSGINQASWVIGGCRIFEDGGPVLDSNGAPRALIATMPKDQLEVHDTWHVAGLRGTGSCDYSTESTFVPQAFATGALDGPRRGEAWLQLPGPSIVAVGHGGFALGIASGVLRELEQSVAASSRSMTASSIGDRESFQLNLGRYRVQFDAARTLMLESHRDVWATVVEGRRPDPGQLTRMRLAGVHATELAVQIAEFGYKAAGSAALFETSPLQRALRDILAAQQHIYVRDQAYVDYAKARLERIQQASEGGASAAD